ncbi:DUF6954 family protein [Paenibacillus sp. sgz5001063]|uniref:DUF6954 family protein n=1 Tax=Paenibacillus sp. sgz5001063 TaxID=3242474 RepID=UPI0036D22BB9
MKLNTKKSRLTTCPSEVAQKDLQLSGIGFTAFLVKGGMRMRGLLYVLFAALYLLTTFFGLGPVLLADGSTRERVLTLIVVLLIYAAITVWLRFILKRLSRR